jgi:hypothetical protein
VISPRAPSAEGAEDDEEADGDSEVLDEHEDGEDVGLPRDALLDEALGKEEFEGGDVPPLVRDGPPHLD